MSGGGQSIFESLVAKHAAIDQGVSDMKSQMLKAGGMSDGEERNGLMKKVEEGLRLMNELLRQMKDENANLSAGAVQMGPLRLQPRHLRPLRSLGVDSDDGFAVAEAMQSMYVLKERVINKISEEFELLQAKMLEDDTSGDRGDNVSETREEGGIMINIENQHGDQVLEKFNRNLFAESVDDIKEHIVKKKGYDIENVNLKLRPNEGISIDGPLMDAGLDVQTLPGGNQVVKLYLHLNEGPKTTASAGLGQFLSNPFSPFSKSSVKYVVVITNLKAVKADKANTLERPKGTYWLLFTTEPRDVDKLKAEIHTEIKDKFKTPDFKEGELLFAGEKLTQDKFDAVEFGNLPPIFNYNFIDSPLGKVGVPFYDFSIMGLSAAFIAALIMSLFGVALSYRIL